MSLLPTSSGLYFVQAHLQPDLSDKPYYVTVNPEDGGLRLRTELQDVFLFYFDVPTSKVQARPIGFPVTDSLWWQPSTPQTCATTGTFLEATATQESSPPITLGTDHILRMPSVAATSQAIAVSVEGEGNLAISVLPTGPWLESGCVIQPFTVNSPGYLSRLEMSGLFCRVDIYQGDIATVLAKRGTLLGSAPQEIIQHQATYQHWNQPILLQPGVNYAFWMNDCSDCNTGYEFYVGLPNVNAGAAYLTTGSAQPAVMNGNAASFGLYTSLNDPTLLSVGLFCGSGTQNTLYTVFEKVENPNPYTILKNLLTEITDPKDPNFNSCNPLGSAGGNVCFYNHGSGTFYPVFTDISLDPFWVLGFNVQTPSSPPVKSSCPGPDITQTAYLPIPSDAKMSNNIQASTSTDCQAAQQIAENPDYCSTFPDQYCRCDDANEVCGLSCAPGTKAVKHGNPVYEKTTNQWVQAFQCYRPVWVGCAPGVGTSAAQCGTGPGGLNKWCTQWNDANPPCGTSTGQTQCFSDEQACLMQWQDCPAGFHRQTVGGTTLGCFRDGNYQTIWNSDCPSSCAAPGDSDRCAALGYTANCGGNCTPGGCDCYCYDTETVPQYAFACTRNDNQESGWHQCLNAAGCPRNSRFNIKNDIYCTAGDAIYPDPLPP